MSSKNTMLRASGPVVAPLLLLLCGCSALDGMLAGAQKPGARVVGVDIAGLSFDSVDLKFDVEVSNPYGVPLPIAAIDYALGTGGRPFLNGNTEEQGTIPAKGARVVPVTAKVGFMSLLETVSGIRPGAMVPYEAEIGFSVDVPGGQRLRLPVRDSGTFPVPTVPTVTLTQIKWESLSLNEASAVLGLEVGNGNSFSFNLDGLSYALSLAKTDIVTSSVKDMLEVDANGRATLQIPISFKPSNLGLAAFRMLGGAGADYSMKGSANLLTPFGRLSAPFTGEGRTAFVK